MDRVFELVAIAILTLPLEGEGALLKDTAGRHGQVVGDDHRLILKGGRDPLGGGWRGRLKGDTDRKRGERRDPRREVAGEIVDGHLAKKRRGGLALATQRCPPLKVARRRTLDAGAAR